MQRLSAITRDERERESLNTRRKAHLQSISLRPTRESRFSPRPFMAQPERLQFVTEKRKNRQSAPSEEKQKRISERLRLKRKTEFQFFQKKHQRKDEQNKYKQEQPQVGRTLEVGRILRPQYKAHVIDKPQAMRKKKMLSQRAVARRQSLINQKSRNLRKFDPERMKRTLWRRQMKKSNPNYFNPPIENSSNNSELSEYFEEGGE